MVHQKISSQCKSFTTYFQDIWSNPYTPQKLLQTVIGLQRVLVKISSVVQYHINFNFHLLFWKGGL